VARETLRGRLAALEKATLPAVPRGFSLSQLVRLSYGATPEEVGPPERILDKGTQDILDVIREARAPEAPQERLDADIGSG
jgi:hypothetical protein